MTAAEPMSGLPPGARPLALVVGGALDALARLREVAEQVSDEWQYVEDLETAYRARFAAWAEQDPDEPVPASAVRAVEAAIEEIGLIADPHRAIDWLSTFPNVVGLALGRRP